MDETRLKQLAEEAETMTELDRLFLHVVITHLDLAINELDTAIGEASDLASDDERGEPLADQLVALADSLEKIIEGILSTIPGIPSPEEAKSFVEERAKDLLGALVVVPDKDIKR